MENELDLKTLWQNQGSAESEAYFQSIAPDLEEKVKQDSQDIFQKIKKNIYVESALGVVFSIIGLVFFYPTPVYFYTFLVLVIAIGIFSAVIYNDLFKVLNRMNDLDIRTSLSEKIKALSRYIRVLLLYGYIVAPIAFYYGFSYHIFAGEPMDSDELSFLFLFSLPFLVGFILFYKKYIYFLYGKYLKRLKGIYEGLEEK